MFAFAKSGSVAFLLLAALTSVSMHGHANWKESVSKGHFYTIDYIPEEPRRPLPSMQRWELANETSAPVSAWQSRNAEFYKSLLVNAPGSTLILPVTVQARGFTRSQRALMTHDLISAVQRSGESVAIKTELNLEAFQYPRSISWEEAKSVADLVGANQIVAVHAGFGEQGYDSEEDILANRPSARMDMAVTLQTLERNGSTWGEVAQRGDFIVEFSHHNPPPMAFKEVLPELISKLGYTFHPAQPARPSESISDINLTFQDAQARDNQSAESQALYLQLLATLTPTTDNRRREDLYRRSLELLPELNEHNKLLWARGYAGIHLYAYARNLLRNSNDTAAACFLHYLNANITSLKVCAEEVEGPVLNAIAALELYHAATMAGVADSQLATTVAELTADLDESWTFFVMTALQRLDPWQTTDIALIKQKLDQEFPLLNYTLDSVRSTMLVLGRSNSIDLELSPLRHVAKWKEQHHAQIQNMVSTSASQLDQLKLLQSAALGALYAEAERLIYQQGAYRRGVSYIESLSSETNGYPPLHELKSDGLIRLAYKAAESERTHLQERAIEEAALTYYWEQEETTLAGDAYARIQALHRMNPPMGRLWERDFPYSANDLPQDMAAPAHYIHLRFDLFEPILEEMLIRGAGLGELKDRFVGYPQITVQTAHEAFRIGDYDQALELYESVIANSPDNSRAHRELVMIYLLRDRVEDAWKTATSYSPIANETATPIELSNIAGEYGAAFAKSGEWQQAIHFLNLAASSQSGSQMYFEAIKALAGISRDYNTYFLASRQIAAQYGHEGALADVIAMLFALEDAQLATDVLNNSIANDRSMSIWAAAAVHQRMAEYNLEEMLTWAPDNKGASMLGSNLAAHLARFYTTDRIPENGVIEILEAQTTPRLVKKQRPSGLWTPLIAASLYGADKPNPKFGESFLGKDGKPMSIYPAPEVYFARAHALIASGEFAEAEALLEGIHKVFDLRTTEYGILLPLLLKAKTHTGETDDFSDFAVTSRDGQGHWGSEQESALAIIAAYRGEVDLAVSHLKRALAFAKPTKSNPVNQRFQLAVLSNWLGQQYKDERYQAFAFTVAETELVNQPYSSWAHAVQALTAEDSDYAVTAAAMTYHLDPGSRLAQDFSKSTAGAARSTLADGNPFIQHLQTLSAVDAQPDDGQAQPM